MEDQLNRLLAKDEIMDVINTLFSARDERDWPGVETCFADLVRFDISSLVGGEARILSPSEITDTWQAGLTDVKAVHHQTSNHRISVKGNRAKARFYAITFHFLDGSESEHTRKIIGNYELHLIRIEYQWKVESFTYHLKFIDGNVNAGA